MADMGTKLKNYGIGAVAGLVIYRFLLEKKYPNIFKPLDTMSEMNKIGETGAGVKTGCVSCGQNKVM